MPFHSFLWRFNVAGNNQTHLSHVKCSIFLPDFKNIWISKDFHKSSKYQISRKCVQWQPQWSTRSNGRRTWSDYADTYKIIPSSFRSERMTVECGRMVPFRSWLYLLVGLAPIYIYGMGFHERQGMNKLINCKFKLRKSSYFVDRIANVLRELPFIRNQPLKSTNK
jgi:hypothetical protein